MKLIYVFNGRLPTEKAHGVQVARSCEGFAKAGCDVSLVVPFRKNTIREDIFDYYGVSRIFNLVRVRSPDLMDREWLPGRLRFHLQNSLSLISILRAIWPDRRNLEVVFYARDYSTLWTLSFLGFRPVAEIHDYRLERPRGFFRFILKKAKAIVVNSEGTKTALKRDYGISEDSILVAPNAVDIPFFDISQTK